MLVLTVLFWLNNTSASLNLLTISSALYLFCDMLYLHFAYNPNTVSGLYLGGQVNIRYRKSLSQSWRAN